MDNLQSHPPAYQRYLSLLEKVKQERKQREAIINSNEYCKQAHYLEMIDKERNAILENQYSMTRDQDAKLGQLQIELEQAERAFADWMVADQREEYGDFQLRIKRKFAIKPSEVLDAMGGDMAAFDEVIKVPRTTLEEFIKGQTDPVFKRSLRACIKEESREIEGVKFKHK